MKQKTVITFFLLLIVVFGGISCRVQSDIDQVDLDSTQFRNGRVALYATYDKTSEKMMSWSQHSVLRQEYGKIEYRIELVGLASQEFQQCILQETPPSLLQFFVYRIETDAEEKKENDTSFEKELLYKGEKKGRSFYAHNYTTQSPKVRRVYVGNQCFEKELLPTLLCSFPVDTDNSITLRWVDSRIPRQEETDDTLEGTVSIIVDQVENVQAKGSEHSAYKLLIPSWETVVWIREEEPHIMVKMENNREVTVLSEWNGI
ncbi:MAG TPA: hypothetical protein PLE09_05195 [Caldisericia bacterium]|jgi:hypothetical protein|nr:hypothetical protein [Caldisericia bacterium]